MQRPFMIVACLVCLYLPSLLVAQDAPGTITTIKNPYSSGGVISVQVGVGPGIAGTGGLAFDMEGNLYFSNSSIGIVFLPDGSSKIFWRLLSTIRDFGDGFPAASYGFVRSAGAIDAPTSIALTAGMTTDLKGNLYIAASFDQRVRLVDSNGILRTTAGSGNREFRTGGFGWPDSVRGGYSGDGGPATRAQLNRPADVAFDAQGNLYIADCANGRIRLVNREGFISTFAGNGGKLADPPGDGGAAISAVLFTPVSVAVDLKGNVYVAELYAHRVRKIGTDDQHTITTFAGTGQAGYSGDGGPATKARLNYPIAVAADVMGNVYIADYQNSRVRKVDANGVITTFAGNGLAEIGSLGDGGPATQARIDYPRDIAVNMRGYVYFSQDMPENMSSTRVLLRRITPEKPFEIPSIRLSGTSVSFVATSVNTPVEQTFSVSNAGKETPLLSEVALDENATDFKVISQTNFLVQPGESYTVKVRYTPASLKATSGKLMVYHSGSEDNPLTVTLNAVPGTTKSADFTGDSKVDFDDFFLFAAAFGGSGAGDNAKFDLDGNGKIDFDDFFLFAAKFGK